MKTIDMNLTVKGTRLHRITDDAEVAVATKASPQVRAEADEIAARLAECWNACSKFKRPGEMVRLMVSTISDIERLLGQYKVLADMGKLDELQVRLGAIPCLMNQNDEPFVPLIDWEESDDVPTTH